MSGIPPVVRPQPAGDRPDGHADDMRRHRQARLMQPVAPYPSDEGKGRLVDVIC